MHTPTLALLSTLAFLPAQQDDAPGGTRATPAVSAPHIRVQTFGPDGWRMRLGPTNLGALCASEKGQAIWQPLLQPLRDALQQGLGGDDNFAAAQARWSGYGGQVTIGIWADPSSRMHTSRTSVLGIVLHADGRTDLEALAEDLRQVAYQSMAGEWRDQTFGDKSYRVRAADNGVAFDPIVTAEHVQLLIVDGDEAAVATALAQFSAFAEEVPQPRRPDSPALVCSIDMDRLVAGMLEHEGDRKLMVALGMKSLGDATVKIGTAGPRVHVSMSQTFTQAARGMFAALLPVANSTSDLGQLVPTDAALWKVGRFDLRVLFDSIVDALVASESAERDEILQAAHKETGIHIVDDLLAHMTDEVMFALGDSPEDDTEPGEWTPSRTNWVLAWKLRDTNAFATGLESVLRSARPFLSREATHEDGQVKFHRYGNMFSYDIWLTTGNGLFGIAGGADAEESLGALQERAAKKLEAGADAKPAPMPRAQTFAQLERWLPANAYGLGFGHPSWLMAGPTGLWLEIWSDLVPLPPTAWPDMGGDDETRANARALLREHQLDRVLSATGQDQNVWTLSIYW